ncbi:MULTISPECIES: outer membrane beta-barrel protein [Agarivorans]|uniref:Outer membrane protein beta-barrel domain-containing protein n=1 Tax=Agarivorans albus MKT 106 TaxID=1331007 RepID=R9PL62_AGAAL|nr:MULTISPECIES: outer membrane beta-barrel protein [Agarivorans]GAD02003.1 hypothetical protein AALB_2083 [Agarivorans albus MKT 106]
MKKAALIGLSLLAFGANASDAPRDFYVGLNLLPTGTIDIDALSQDLDLGASFAFGKRFDLDGGWLIDGEIEYLYMGSNTMSNNGLSMETTGSGLSLNVKPTYKFSDSGLYLAGLVGVGSYSVELEVRDDQGSIKAEDDGLGFTYGLEAGYDANRFGLALGYKNVAADIDSLSVDYSSFYFGAKYKF